MSEVTSKTDVIQGIEVQHKLLNLLMGYWTVFASQKKEYDLQNRIMEAIKHQAALRVTDLEIKDIK